MVEIAPGTKQLCVRLTDRRLAQVNNAPISLAHKTTVTSSWDEPQAALSAEAADADRASGHTQVREAQTSAYWDERWRPERVQRRLAHVAHLAHHVPMRIPMFSRAWQATAVLAQVLLGTALLATSTTAAQTPPTRPAASDSGDAAPLLGDVVDALGRPMPNVEVYLAGTDLTTRTDARGFWIFPNPPRGARVLGARALGYAPFARALNISAQRPDTIPIALRRLPRTLSAVKIQATYAGAVLEATAMAERILQLRVSTGKLYTRDSILARQPQSMVDLLMGIPGIVARREQQGFSVVSTRSGTGALAVAGSPCPVQFFVNRAAVDIDFVASMSPLQWQSVEVHPVATMLSGLPMVSGTCGAVVITMM